MVHGVGGVGWFGSGGLESTPEERHVIVIDEFCDAADELRQVYDDKFADPIEVSGDRFVWDFWHVPNQYTFVRTIAEDYFPPVSTKGVSFSICSKVGRERERQDRGTLN